MRVCVVCVCVLSPRFAVDHAGSGERSAGITLAGVFAGGAVLLARTHHTVGVDAALQLQHDTYFDQ